MSTFSSLEHVKANQFTRRQFLVASGAAVFAAPATADEFRRLGQPSRRIARIRRDRDLLNLEIEFVNFREANGLLVAELDQSYVVLHFPPQNLAEAIYEETHDDSNFEIDPLVIKKNAFPIGNKAKSPIRSYLSGPSRVAFAVPNGQTVPWKPGEQSTNLVDEWMKSLARWNLRVPAEFTKSKYVPRPGRPDETCLEIPYRLQIAPTTDKVRLLTSSERMPFDPRPANEWELWSGQLISRVKLDPAKPPDVITNEPDLKPLEEVSLQGLALYSPDYRKPGEPEPKFEEYFPGRQMLSLHSLTRHRLVKQMSERNGWIDIDHLILTSLGSDAFLAYFNGLSYEEIIQNQLNQSKAEVATPEQLKTIQDKIDHNQPLSDEEKKLIGLNKDAGTQLMVWKHRMVLGRDEYFVEAFFGVLFPMVFPSLYVEVTQRKFVSRREDKDGNDVVEPSLASNPNEEKIGPPGAFLMKRRFIVVRQPDRQFADSTSSLGRSMPIKSVQLNVTRSPDLEDPSQRELIDDFEKKDAFPSPGLLFLPRPINAAPKDRGKALTWPITFTDESGQQVKTSEAYLLFASNVIKGQIAWDRLKDDYRNWNVPPQPLALAPEQASVPNAITGSRVLVGRNERDGVASLGDALKHWHGAVTLTGTNAEAEYQKLIQSSLDRLRPYLATISAAMAEVELHWKDAKGSADNFKKTLLALIEDTTDAGIAKIEQAIRAAQADLNKPIDEIMARVANEAGRIRRAMEDVTATTIKDLDAVLKSKKTEVNEFLQTVHSDFRKVATVAASLETHKIRFGSVLADSYLKSFAQPLFKTVADLPTVQNLRTQFDALKKTDKLVANEFKRTLDRLEKEIQAIESAGDQAVKPYLDQLNAVQKQATDIGSHQFHAIVEQVEGIVPSMKAVVPNYDRQVFEHMPEFVAQGIHGVKNGMFAQLGGDPDAQVEAIKKKITEPINAIKNGIGTPRTLIQGLSNQLGAVAASKLDDLKAMANNAGEKLNLDLKDAIPKSNLFGVIPLDKLIGLIGGNNLPSVNIIQTPEEWSHTWKWTIPIDRGDKPFGILTFSPNKKTVATPSNFSFHLSILTKAKLPKAQQALNGAQPSGTVFLDGYLGLWNKHADRPSPPPEGADPKVNSAFSIKLLQMIDLSFRQVRISAEYPIGETPKPKVRPEIVGVTFIGPLQFVMKLQSYLSNLGGGFQLAVLPDFIELKYGFLLPPISFGAFSLRNILLTAGLMLPFGDKPLRFSFGLSSFAIPFEMSVLCFGGRGFLRVEIDTHGGRTLEGALEFGGVFAFDCGVASGGLYVVAGIYFKITNEGSELAGYLRAGGNIQVIGLIHITVEFILMVTWRKSPEGSELYGTCTITVSIEMLFFSISVGVTFEKRIAGSSNGDGGEQQVQRSLTQPMREPTRFVSFEADEDGRELVRPVVAEATTGLPLERDRTYFQRDDYAQGTSPDKKLNGRYRAGEDGLFERDWEQFDLPKSTR